MPLWEGGIWAAQIRRLTKQNVSLVELTNLMEAMMRKPRMLQWTAAVFLRLAALGLPGVAMMLWQNISEHHEIASDFWRSSRETKKFQLLICVSIEHGAHLLTDTSTSATVIGQFQWIAKFYQMLQMMQKHYNYTYTMPPPSRTTGVLWKWANRDAAPPLVEEYAYVSPSVVFYGLPLPHTLVFDRHGAPSAAQEKCAWHIVY